MAIADAKASVVTLFIPSSLTSRTVVSAHHLDAESGPVFYGPQSLAVYLPAQPWPAILSENDEELCPRPT
jgi:hypothetical protein